MKQVDIWGDSKVRHTLQCWVEVPRKGGVFQHIVCWVCNNLRALLQHKIKVGAEPKDKAGEKNIKIHARLFYILPRRKDFVLWAVGSHNGFLS